MNLDDLPWQRNIDKDDGGWELYAFIGRGARYRVWRNDRDSRYCIHDDHAGRWVPQQDDGVYMTPLLAQCMVYELLEGGTNDEVTSRGNTPDGGNV